MPEATLEARIAAILEEHHWNPSGTVCCGCRALKYTKSHHPAELIAALFEPVRGIQSATGPFYLVVPEPSPPTERSSA